ncbi:MAG TPA: DeoR family transcriptional regulator [Candidatus Paceibacterota bacterium]|nr:DeoR family transcriptional regulator [Candidatus Paceibacterota bacterium]
MNETGNSAWILKKSYEIAYAVFRIAGSMDPAFAEHMKYTAMVLLGSAARENYAEATKITYSLQYLTRFAMDVNMMGMNNGELLLKEIERLASALGETWNHPATETEAHPAEEVDISDIFTDESAMPIRQNRQAIKPAKNNLEKAAEMKLPESNHNVEQVSEHGAENQSEENQEESGSGGLLKAAIRQSAILERIRQIGNCRIKDIEEILPDSSERTIRYDLQTLVEQNLIERVGAGGPSVFYRIRQ